MESGRIRTAETVDEVGTLGGESPSPSGAICATEFEWIVQSGGSAQLVGIGSARLNALFVMNSVDPVQMPASEGADARLTWIGDDDRGIELEIVALDLPDAVVIHVMPTELRR